MSEDDGGGRSRRRVAHYAQRTVSTSAPEFANHEQDVIRQSFSTGNHTWMKEALPVELAPDTVNQLRRQRMERSRLAEPPPQTWSKMTQLWGGGCYQEFEYIPDEYDRKIDFGKNLRKVANDKRDKISNHDFRYASQERRMKHEPMINDPRNKEAYPYLGGDKDQELQAHSNWLRNGSVAGSLPGGLSSSASKKERSATAETTSFLAGRGSGLDDESRGSRMTLPTVVQRLQKRLDADWEGTSVVVSVTDQDLVQVAFHLGTVDSERGVAAYMSVLSKDPELLGALGLRKVSQLWGMRRDFSADAPEGIQKGSESMMMDVNSNTWMFYLFSPKWVRMRPTDAYYTAHPRSQGSAFRMSTAGSSVLLSLGSSVLDPGEPTRVKSAMRGAGNAEARDGGQDFLTASARAGEDRIELNTIERALGGLPSIRQASRGGGPLSAR